jgi:putative phosphotransacetylase
MKVPIEISARHIHLSKEDCEKILGGVCIFNYKKALSQHGQYAAEETIDLVNGDRIIKNVRVLGPPREETQVEIAQSDAFALHLMNVPLRLSGDTADTPGITLRGEKGDIEIKKGVIIAKRHMHISTTQAKEAGLHDGQAVQIKIPGERGIIFENVIVRVRDDFELAVHLDTDEANAAGVTMGTIGEIII